MYIYMSTRAPHFYQGKSLCSPRNMAHETVIRIAHFNDVYQVIQEVTDGYGRKETFGVAKFATLLEDITNKWPARKDDASKKDGLVVFSGDLFSPSTESSVTRGAHMPSIINALNVDVGCAGNHEFDFGYPHLRKLLNLTSFPWLLSNIVDTTTNKVPGSLKEFCVLDRCGIRIGFIGLVEKDWIATVAGWPENFKHVDMAQVGKALSAKLREEEKCDLVIAVTHSRFPNDIQLARDLYALSPVAQATKDITSQHGVDILLGGHDHIYWISKGVTQWNGYDLQTPVPDTESDKGDVLIIKTGTDYQDISEVFLTLKDAPKGSVRKKIIQSVKGSRHTTTGETPLNERVQKIVDVELETVNESLKEPICYSEVDLDLRSVRFKESAIGNWITDTLRHAYDVPLKNEGYEGADGVLIGSGDIRGEKVYPPGQLTMRDLMAILPFPDPMVVLEVSGNDLWDAFESGLSKWPSAEGRFPVFSGFYVEWDGKRPAGKRVLKICLRGESKETGPDGVRALINKEEITRSTTRKYTLMTSEYLADGGDGYVVFKNKPQILSAESGQPKSALIRKFLLGAQLMNKLLHERSPKAQEGLTSADLYTAAFRVADQEDIGFLDPYERCRARLIRANSEELESTDPRMKVPSLGSLSTDTAIHAAEQEAMKHLPVIHPVIDGRLKNVSA